MRREYRLEYLVGWPYDYRQKYFDHAVDVVRFVESLGLTNYEVCHQNMYGEYIRRLEVEDGIRTYENPELKRPRIFEKLGKRKEA